jgi:hypothetical protein
MTLRPPSVREAKRVLQEFNRAQRAARPKAPPKPDTVKRPKPTWGRDKNEKHLAFIRQLPCFATMIRCGFETIDRSEAAHVRFSKGDVKNPGLSVKPSDWRTLPASSHEHRAQHARGDEEAYWQELGVTDPYSVCRALYAISGDLEAALEALRQAASVARARKLDGTVVPR